jgi:hypothetical protein
MRLGNAESDSFRDDLTNSNYEGPSSLGLGLPTLPFLLGHDSPCNDEIPILVSGHGAGLPCCTPQFFAASRLCVKGRPNDGCSAALIRERIVLSHDFKAAPRPKKQAPYSTPAIAELIASTSAPRSLPSVPFPL